MQTSSQIACGLIVQFALPLETRGELKSGALPMSGSARQARSEGITNEPRLMICRFLFAVPEKDHHHCEKSMVQVLPIVPSDNGLVFDAARALV